MSMFKIFCIYFTFLCADYQTKMVTGIFEHQSSCEFDLKKSLPLNGAHHVELKIETNFKQELLLLRENLLEYMQKELALQRDEFAKQNVELMELIHTVKAQKKELTNIKHRLDDQKELTESFMKYEIIEQQRKNQAEITNVILKVCDKELAEKNQKLTQLMAENFSYQVSVQEELITNALKAIAPPPVDSSRWDKNFNCILYCGPIMELPNSCEEAMFTAHHRNGVYLLSGTNDVLRPFYAYCKRMDDKVWTVIQRREDGSVDFYRNWNDYKYGFGNLIGEFWLGLERMHALTTKHKHELHIWMENKYGKKSYAHYDQIMISNEDEKYKLIVEGYSGNAKDGFISSINGSYNGLKFSTYDNCNDQHGNGTDECAKVFKGAWWFKNCFIGHLNGPYNATNDAGIVWVDFFDKLKYVQMAIRRS